MSSMATCFLPSAWTVDNSRRGGSPVAAQRIHRGLVGRPTQGVPNVEPPV